MNRIRIRHFNVDGRIVGTVATVAMENDMVAVGITRCNRKHEKTSSRHDGNTYAVERAQRQFQTATPDGTKDWTLEVWQDFKALEAKGYVWVMPRKYFVSIFIHGQVLSRPRTADFQKVVQQQLDELRNTGA